MQLRLKWRLIRFMTSLLCVSWLGSTAQAQEAWPSRPIHLIACCAGVIDSVARMVGEEMSSTLKQSVVVEPKPGASGMIGAEYVSKAKPDGYTIFFGTNSTHGANQSLFKKVPYDYIKDFAPLSGIAEGKLVLVVNPSSPVKSIAELTALAKSKPGKLTYGWASSSTRLAMEMYKQLAGVDILDVPYKTNPQATMDISGGQIDMMFADLATAAPLIQAGRLRPLAVSGSTRVKGLPKIPTMQEAGVPNYKLTWWVATWAPAGTPVKIVNQLNAAVAKAISTPKVQKAFTTFGVEPMPLSPDQLMKFQLAEHENWARIIHAAGIQPQ